MKDIIVDGVAKSAAYSGHGGDPCGQPEVVSVDAESGDLAFPGRTITDTDDLAQVSKYSTIAANESVVRVRSRMRPTIVEVIGGGEAPVVS